MLFALQLLSANATRRPTYQRPYINMAERTLPTSQLCLLMDTEGDSPLEVAVAIVKDGELVKSQRWLCKPTVDYQRERWGMRNIHGIDYHFARRYGLTRPDLNRQVAEWLEVNIMGKQQLLPDGKLVNVYFPGAIGGGDRAFYESLRLRCLAEPNFIELDQWTVRVTRAYHNVKAQPNVDLCPIANHSAYNPMEIERQAVGPPVSRTAYAKLLSGHHCALKDVIELYQYMHERHYFDKDFPVA
jgi:hypothetical protein